MSKWRRWQASSSPKGAGAKASSGAVKPQRREQREKPEDVVAVQVRDERGPQFQRVDAVADELLLHALARVHEVILFVDVHRLRRRMPVGRGFGRGAAEDGDRETHGVIAGI